MKNNFLILALAALLFTSSCEIINPSEDIPAYLNIETIDVEASDAEGSSSQKITDAWVYVDAEYIGVYPLPARIPILEEGVKTVTIYPGIKLNGASSDRDIYPFYDFFEGDVEFVPSEDVTINPTVGYSDKSVFELVESFENSTHVFSVDIDGDEVTSFSTIASGGFEGGSAVATLSEGHFEVLAGTDYYTSIPEPNAVNGFTSFVEVNFKTDVNFKIGLVAYDQGDNLIYISLDRTVVRTDEWNKVYFDMTTPFQEIAQSPGVKSYRVVLAAVLNSDPASLDTMPEAKIYVDNIKFIRF